MVNLDLALNRCRWNGDCLATNEREKRNVSWLGFSKLGFSLKTVSIEEIQWVPWVESSATTQA
jgi:hypothetical protein